jgi:hypothetical protein
MRQPLAIRSQESFVEGGAQRAPASLARQLPSCLNPEINFENTPLLWLLHLSHDRRAKLIVSQSLQFSKRKRPLPCHDRSSRILNMKLKQRPCALIKDHGTACELLLDDPLDSVHVVIVQNADAGHKFVVLPSQCAHSCASSFNQTHPRER